MNRPPGFAPQVSGSYPQAAPNLQQGSRLVQSSNQPIPNVGRGRATPGHPQPNLSVAPPVIPPQFGSFTQPPPGRPILQQGHNQGQLPSATSPAANIQSHQQIPVSYGPVGSPPSNPSNLGAVGYGPPNANVGYSPNIPQDTRPTKAEIRKEQAAIRRHIIKSSAASDLQINRRRRGSGNVRGGRPTLGKLSFHPKDP